MTKILIDSDVIFDIFQEREQFCTASLNVLLKVEQGHYDGFVTTIAIANIYYVIRKEINRDVALNCIRQLIKTDGIEVLQVDRHAIEEALDSEMKDFEDAIQASVADREEMDLIITRNLRHYKKSKIPALSPLQLLERFGK